ncbi:response regulator transcription factor [Ginsengibacter hankyongi]|uniref:Response regulator transcription factor n=1 Tax=Ginsengibacter hankyongi TaxID=2607284 RepID=A0A5J5IG19_9BACT|nr:response regulator transcription factor [Ginsengibacter hankyongi]KAA9038749.1 response regulator transcription factor [Ginsengibacter hankyongi]
MASVKTKIAKPINVLIIDDHKMVRDGLKVMLGSLKQFMQFSVFEAESGEEALKKKDFNAIDLMIIDYNMPGMSGAETVFAVLRSKPEMKILALSNYSELPYIQNMVDAGAKGYILKNIEPAEMLRAIKTILSGNKYFSNEVAIKLLDEQEEKTMQKIRLQKFITPRENQVLQMIAREMTSKQIGEQLFVNSRTVDSHRRNLTKKLNAKNTVGLIKIAYKLNLIEE